MPPHTDPPRLPASTVPTSRRRLTGLVLPLLGLFLVAAVFIVFHRNINWDEFYFLSFIHEHDQGRPLRSLQTFHVHLFSWITAIEAKEIGQVLAGRTVMLACLLTTALFIFLIGRHFSGEAPAGLVGVLAFATSGFVLAHGASFRTDPIIACLLMAALSILLLTRLSLWQMVVAALLAAVAILVSVKSVLYLPAFLGVVVWRCRDREKVARMLGTGALLVLCLVGLYAWHVSQIQGLASEPLDRSAVSILKTTILSGAFIPQNASVSVWLMLTAVPLLLATIAIAAPPGPAADRARLRLTLGLFVLPLASVLVYRNAFPYFFPFIVPPLMVVAGIGAASPALRRSFLAKLLLVMAVSGGLQVWKAATATYQAQAETLAAVHAMFPEPVPYIDRNSMVATFPKVGFFMSGWGLQKYHDAGVPVFPDVIEAHQPPLLIANSPVLLEALTGEETAWSSLLPKDQRVLRQTYRHHAGAIWLAGVSAAVGPEPTEVRVRVGGPYRVEADGPIRINGQTHAPGSVVVLASGPVTLSADPRTTMDLVWAVPGDPHAKAPDAGLYAPFW